MAKGVLPYHGIGSGIKRALADWPDITFTDDRDGCLFTATVNRKAVASTKTPGKTPVESSPIGSPNGSPISSPKTADIILGMLRQNQTITTELLASKLEISKRAILKQIATLKKQGRVRRLGPTHGGHWEVLK